MTNFVASSQWEEPKQKRYFEEKIDQNIFEVGINMYYLDIFKMEFPIMIIKYEDLVYKKRKNTKLQVFLMKIIILNLIILKLNYKIY